MKRVPARVWTRGRCPTDQARWRDAAASWLTRTKLGLVGARSTVTARRRVAPSSLQGTLGTRSDGRSLGIGRRRAQAIRHHEREGQTLSSHAVVQSTAREARDSGGWKHWNKVHIGCHPFPINTSSPLARGCGSHGSIVHLTAPQRLSAAA